MFYVYILQSKKTGEIYIGCSSDLKKRFLQHNSGSELATRKSYPWNLVYYEAYSTQKLALKREHNLKHYGKSLAMLKKRIGLEM